MKELQLKHSGKIEKYNIPKGCCVYEFCGIHASYYANVKYMNFDITLVFCKKHYEEFSKLLLEEKE